MKSMKVIPEKNWVRIGVRSSSLERDRSREGKMSHQDETSVL